MLSTLDTECFKDLVYNAFSNKNEDASEQLQEYYSCGHCMDLAIAFHRLYGFEIQIVLCHDKINDWIGHAWVKAPNGEYLDIMGSYIDTVELESFGDTKITNLSENDLYEYFNHTSEFEQDIKKAEIVAKYIFKQVEKNN